MVVVTQDFRSTSWRAEGNANGLGCRTNTLKVQVDESRGWTDTLNMSNSAVTASISHMEHGRIEQALGRLKHWKFGMDAETTANAPGNVRIP